MNLVDGLKDLINKEIKKVYDVKLFISASMYSELDKLKDKNGLYLLQDSITSSSSTTTSFPSNCLPLAAVIE
ncbi:phage major capsid protein, partial [Lactococcus lactis]